MPVFTMVFLIAARRHGDAAAQRVHRRDHHPAGSLPDVAAWAFWGVVGIALGAAYLLWLFQRTMLGEISEKNRAMRDLSWREIAVFAPLVAWAFWIGC